MNINRPFNFIIVNQKAENSIRRGHPWVYKEEVISLSESFVNGQIVDVISQKGKYLGSGFINDNSKILVRIVSRNANDRFDDAFWARRIDYAISYRETVLSREEMSSCRLIFGDSDGFPGFIVDKFENVLSIQVLSLGIELIKMKLVDLLLSTLNNRGFIIDTVYERSDAAVRKKEGLDLTKGYLFAQNKPDGHVIITENKIKYDVDYVNGQKTGFFLDQKHNRRAAAVLAKDKTVLDCFTHTGAFALNIAAAGAKRVTAVDISQDAINQAERNAELNGLTNVDFVCENVFDLLTKTLESGKKPYDYIILDPPAFTKSNATVSAAYKGYKDINLRAMRLLPKGGYLATCSCSHFMNSKLFSKMLDDAAADAGVTLKQIESRLQCADHPIIRSIPETEYLKFYILQII